MRFACKNNAEQSVELFKKKKIIEEAKMRVESEFDILGVMKNLRKFDIFKELLLSENEELRKKYD